MLNPWAILGGILLLIATYFGGDHFGHKHGINEQKVADQEQFDKVNNKLTAQKADASAKYRDAQGSIIAALADRDKFKNQLGAEHVKNQNITSKLNDTYAAYSLRFQSAESPGCGSGDSSTASSGGNATGNGATKTIQLPDEITRNLRQLVEDADRLNDDYKLCYGYANKIDPIKTESGK